MNLLKTNFLILIFFLTLTLPCQGQGEEEKTYFDVKTKFAEKTDLMAAKLGTIIFIINSDWAGIKEIGEDYSLWLKNYKRKKEKDTIYVSLDVEIRTPAMFRSGSLLESRKIEVHFKAEDTWQGVKSIIDSVEQEMKNTSQELKKEALFVGEKVIKVVRELIR